MCASISIYIHMYTYRTSLNADKECGIVILFDCKILQNLWAPMISTDFAKS